MKYFLFILFSLSFSETIGGYAGSSFRYGTSAREIALGNALISNNNGFNALVNPALLSDLKSNEYGFSYFSLSLDRSVQVLSISNILPANAGVSLSYVKTGTNDIPLKDNSNNYLGKYNHSESYGAISFGTRLYNVSFGLSLKAFFNKMPNNSAKGIGLDFGIKYNINDFSQIGFVCKDINSKYSWDNENNSIIEEVIPLTYALGYTYVNNDILIAFRFNSLKMNEYNFEESMLGIEYDISTFLNVPLILRCGKNQRSSFNFGFGYPINLSDNNQLIIDYSIDTNVFEKGGNHLISLTFIKGDDK